MQPLPLSKTYVFPVLYDPETFYPDAQKVYIYSDQKYPEIEKVFDDWAKLASEKNLVAFIWDKSEWQPHANLFRYTFMFDCGGSGSEKTFTSLCDLLSNCGVPITKVIFDDLG